MSGTINLALSQQFDMDGEPLGGGLLYFFAAGTTTPQSAFQDQLLTILHPNPIVLDASGRVPMFYLADGNIKIRLTDDTGVTVIAADNLLVVGPSSGGGGGGGVDPTTVLQPGDMLVRFGAGTHDGFVRCNGNTIGSNGSSATERADADCQVLFEYLWSTNVLGVFAGATPSRGATANGDWIANKQIALPDLRGRTIAGMDDMGAPVASRLTATHFGTSATALGSAGGLESNTLDTTTIPAHSHGVGSLVAANESSHQHGVGTYANGVELTSHQHLVPPLTITPQTNVSISGSATVVGNVTYGALTGLGSLTDVENVTHNHTITGSSGTGSAHTHTLSGSTANNAGGGSAHKNVQPTMVLTFYMKL